MFPSKTNTQKGTILLLVLLALIVTGIPSAYAQSGEITQGGLNETLTTMMSVVAMINTFMHILLLIILNMLGYLLQADFLNDLSMMSALNRIWVLSRNIMNVLFAVMLIGVAIYTIFTANSELIKSKIANFILAVILVNFSWFFPRVIIDVANVLTATVYGIPSTISSGCTDFRGDPCRVITDVKILPKPEEIQPWKDGPACAGAVCVCPSELTCYATREYSSVASSMGAAHVMIDGMATSFINIAAMTQIPKGIDVGANPGTIAAFRTTISIVMNIMMTLFVQVAVVLPLVGLGVGLFIRIIILWVTVAFMPFTFLGFVINGKIGTNIFGFETDIWQEFINAAFLPAVVGIPFVIGFVMLSTVSQIGIPSGFDQSWGFPLLAGINNWWEMLWMFAAVGIIWIGSFAALARSKVTGRVTEKIKGFGDAIFRAGLQLPLILPLPVGIGPKGQTTTLGGILNAPRAIGNKINRAALGFPEPEPGKIGKVDATSVERLGGADDVNTMKIVRAIETLARPDTNGSHKEALRDIHLTVGGDGLSTAETLKQLERHIDERGNPVLKAGLGDLRRAIDESKKK